MSRKLELEPGAVVVSLSAWAQLRRSAKSVADVNKELISFLEEARTHRQLLSDEHLVWLIGMLEQLRYNVQYIADLPRPDPFAVSHVEAWDEDPGMPPAPPLPEFPRKGN